MFCLFVCFLFLRYKKIHTLIVVKYLLTQFQRYLNFLLLFSTLTKASSSMGSIILPILVLTAGSMSLLCSLSGTKSRPSGARKLASKSLTFLNGNGSSLTRCFFIFASLSSIIITLPLFSSFLFLSAFGALITNFFLFLAGILMSFPPQQPQPGNVRS